MKVQNIAILGSTGSIGISTLNVVDRYPDRFKVVALTAYNSHKKLAAQVNRYKPKYVAVREDGVDYLKKNIDTKRTKVLSVEHDLCQLVAKKQIDVVVIGMRGSAALEPFLSAVRAGKRVAPANKEALVIAGELIMREAKKHGATIVPVDSEQSAIFQCLEGQQRSDVKCIHLTASGGTLRNTPKKEFDNLTVKQMLNHPRWKMGPKITIDSATLMNKGFEVIEAQRLFDLKADQIKVVIHPEAIIHSMVEFNDGSIIAQMGITDMQLPIQYAMTYPHRWDTKLADINFAKLGQLNFDVPNFKKFPALELAFYVAKRGGTLPSVLNAADEVAVDEYLNERIKFTKIFSIVEKVVLKHKNKKNPSLKAILEADQWARDEANKLIKGKL